MRYTRQLVWSGLVLTFLMTFGCSEEGKETVFLDFEDYTHYFEDFNKDDNELYKQYVDNDSVIPFLEANIPLLEIPDSAIQKTYYFRWWTFRKHIKETPRGFVITEFLPDVPWAGKYNTINCPAAYHIYEGRWLKNNEFVKDYIDYWLTEAENTRRYSFWVANASLAFSKVNKDETYMEKHLPHLVENYKGWEEERRDAPERLFWQDDNLDGMEFSSGGRVIDKGVDVWSTLAARPTINSYMYADAKAIAELASNFGNDSLSETYQNKAAQIKDLVQNKLWNDSLNFFTILPRDYSDEDKPVAIRELIGYTPWYFNLPDDNPQYAKAWEKVLDTTGFFAPVGLTTCEQSHPYFQLKYEGHECQWNGPSWPFATTQTLKSLSNFLNNYEYNGSLDKSAYHRLLKQYAEAHKMTWENGETQMWIDENLNPYTGDWISRTRLKTWDNGTWSAEKGGKERGKDYNHSGFCDLVINDLIGFKPQWDGSIVVEPLVPEDWDWFCLDNVDYQGKKLTILWDRTGTKFQKGEGFKIFYDGTMVHQGADVSKVNIKI
ncbi:MGH1-like glycoside hydrolase domain-containing protein [Flagellimonas iocasae]|uniref:Glycosyl hydrolase family 65 protein n=1 Tax=Flagellimonas iocasae TaxID=2055905 RepID=A0ABW4Y1E6_9FLAO